MTPAHIAAYLAAGTVLALVCYAGGRPWSERPPTAWPSWALLVLIWPLALAFICREAWRAMTRRDEGAP